MSAVANMATVGLVRELLDVEDTTSVVAKLGSLPDSDVQVFLDFIIYVSKFEFDRHKCSRQTLSCLTRISFWRREPMR